MEQARRAARPLSLLSLDIDHFKAVNDTYGHAAGDYVLQTLVRMLKQHIRSFDLLCRLGGEEFVLLLPNIGGADLATIAESLRGNDRAQFA